MSTVNALIRYAIAISLLLPMYFCVIAAGLIYKPAGWQIMVSWNRLFLKIFGVKVNLEYKKPDMDLSSGGVVVGLTQQSILDAIIGISVAPKMFMSIWNIEYAIIPFIGWISWLYGWVIIRQWPGQARKKLKKAEDHIKNGGFVYLSIEGRRSRDGSLSPFKKGPVVLAIHSQAKIFPFIIQGSVNRLPYGKWKIRPGEVTARFLEPIATAGMHYEDRDALVERLHKMAEQEIEIRSPHGETGRQKELAYS